MCFLNLLKLKINCAQKTKIFLSIKFKCSILFNERVMMAIIHE
jgi:hypothetical protein